MKQNLALTSLSKFERVSSQSDYVSQSKAAGDCMRVLQYSFPESHRLGPSSAPTL